MHLQGKKIFLRSVLPSDAALLFRWENDRTNWQISRTKKPFTKQEIRNFIINQKDIYLDKQLRLMIGLSSPRPSPTGRGSKGEVGCIDLFDFDQPNLKAGIGILIEKKYRRKGYASEALSLLIAYCFEILYLQELHCSITEGNEASIKLFRKHKFRITGKKKNVCSLRLVNQ